MGFKNDDRCLNNPNLGDDEPIFVLRAQDITAEKTIEFWLENARPLSDARRMEVYGVLADFARWRMDNPERVKSPD